ncbi:MAG: hypothetical protein ACI8V2_003224 [Candidatus Latescibacterota bacterium]|jgi:hypothetical protein
MNVTPDLLTFHDGSAVDTASWPRRRKELADTIIDHQFGGMPPEPDSIDIIRRASSSVRHWPGVQYNTYEIHMRFSNAGKLSLTLSLWIPPGDGPFPVLLDGDGCWRYFNDDVISKILVRGNIAASVDRTEAAADNKDEYRNTGLYRLFPDAKFGVCSAWAWAIHRCIDALTTFPNVKTDAVAITGHSRGGKTILLAGATDERIAITNPNNSGIGGAGLHHLKMEGSEVVNSFFGSGNIFWFGEAFAAHRHRDAELPYDNHFLHALVAPRGLLLTEAYEDHSANPAGTYAAARSAQKVYDLLDNKDAIGWAYRESGHAHMPEDYTALLDFMDRHLHNRQLKRDFQRNLYPDLDKYLQNVATTNIDSND